MEGPKGTESMAGARRTILLVDDEPPILEFGKEILGFYGYETLTAENGEAAVELFGRRKDEIGLVVLDLTMPIMDGGECMRRILQIDPDAKVFVSSGFSSKGRVEELLQMGASGFLMKPFRFDDFAREVNAILSNP